MRTWKVMLLLVDHEGKTHAGNTYSFDTADDATTAVEQASDFLEEIDGVLEINGEKVVRL